MSRTKYAYLVYEGDLYALDGKVAKVFRFKKKAIEYLESPLHRHGCYEKVKISDATVWNKYGYYDTVSEDFLESLK